VKTAKEEIASLTGAGTVTGFGESVAPSDVDEAATATDLETGFARSGLSESAARTAAHGR
jgi:hypothetical protein